MKLLLQQLREVPDYFIALKGAVAVLAMGLPIYAGLRYFIYRRRLTAPPGLTFGFISVFILYAGLAFLLASPLARLIVGPILTTYLLLTCLLSALSIVELIDLFLVQHYLSSVKGIYVSPPMRTVIKLTIFCISLLPILRYVLHFNPLTLVAIPTIASAGIAFALQDTLKAFIAGIGLGNMIRIGEWISFQDKQGRVIDINWVRTTMETADGQRAYIPNNLLITGVFLNFTTGSPSNRQSFKISASYDASPALVKETLLKCVEEVPGIGRTPAPQVVLQEYGDSGIVYVLYYWLDTLSQKLQVQDEVATRAWYAFRREGISIPYPIRTLQLQRKSKSSGESTSRLEQSLQGWALATAFYAEELQELSQQTRSRLFAPGEMIVTEGDKGDSLFVIAEGTVDVFSGNGGSQRLASLEPHEIFGEMSLLTGAPRSASVRAKTAVEVLEIEKGGLQKIMARRPELSDKLAELVNQRRAANALPLSEVRGSASAPIATDESLAKKIRFFFGLN